MGTKVDPKSALGKFFMSRKVGLNNVTDKNMGIGNSYIAKMNTQPGITPGVTPAVSPTAPPATPGYTPIQYTPNAINDSTGQINALADASKASTLARMEKARNTATAGLAQEKTLAQQGQITQLGQARTGASTGARNFNEYLASKGLSNSGSVGQGQMAYDIGLMAQEGSINQNLGNTLQDIEGKRNLADQNYDTGIADSYANIEADRARGLIDNTSSVNAQNTANANRLYEIKTQNQAAATEQVRYNTDQEQNVIKAKAMADQQKIENAFNQGQISRQDAEMRRKKVLEDRDYALNKRQVDYSLGKPYYNPKVGKKSGSSRKSSRKSSGGGHGGGHSSKKSSKKNDGLGGFYNN